MANRNSKDLVFELNDQKKAFSIAEDTPHSDIRRNRLDISDVAAHDWYRFVLSYPPHLVRDYLHKFGADQRDFVLDPFCGTGTTLVECKKLGLRAFGVEAHPMSHFASCVKVHWEIPPDLLRSEACRTADIVRKRFAGQGIEDQPVHPMDKVRRRSSLMTLNPAQAKLLLTDCISPLSLHKALVLLEEIDKMDAMVRKHARLALAHTLVNSCSKLHFGPEVGVRKNKIEGPVVSHWLARVKRIADDLDEIGQQNGKDSSVYLADSRTMDVDIPKNSIDYVITSPPYPNEKDYTRTTRLESVLLGFLNDRRQLRSMKQGLVRSNTRNVYVADVDDPLIADIEDVHRLADEIEQTRIRLSKTSGFEKLYTRVTKLYFSGMARHLQELTGFLRPGAKLAYVVGDQASFFRIKIDTAEILAKVAENIGYSVDGIDLFRTRRATATKCALDEEVLCLSWRKK